MVSKGQSVDQEAKVPAPAVAPENAPALINTGALSADVARNFKSFSDIENYFSDLGVDLTTAEEEIGDGYERVDDKDRFLNTTLILVDWTKFESKDYGTDVYSIRLMTLAGEKYRISDGGAGIFQQLEALTANRVAAHHKTPNQGLIVRNGLRASRFWVSVADGKPMTEDEAANTPKDLKKKATTYYLNV